MKNSTPTELCQLANEIGNFIQHWGFKRIHGQIWTLVFLSHKPLHSTYITKKLGVSKALVSLAIKDLLKYKVIQVVDKKNKEIYFQSNPDIFSVIANVLKNREAKMLETIQQKHEDLSKRKVPLTLEYKLDPNRLEELGFMIMAAQSSLKSVVEGEVFELKAADSDSN